MPDLVKIKPRAGMKTSYEVYEEGQMIGVVWSRRVETARMHGRIRYPSGHEILWGIGDEPRPIYQTRKRAVESAVRHFREGRSA